MAADIECYRVQSPWTDPGRWRALLQEVPPVPEVVVRVVSGLLLHPFLAPMRTCRRRRPGDPDDRGDDRPGVRDPSPPAVARAPQNRVFCVCAGFARVATAVFRAHTVPAWVRVGFASYLNSGFWEDHWVCEYRSGETWLLLDAQLDETAVRDFGVDFAPWDVPRDRFLDASTAWRQLRAGELDPSTIGLSAIGLAGAWFVAQSVLRDAAALNNVEMLPWKPGQWAERSAPGRTSRPISPQSSTRWPRSSAAHRTPIWHDGFTASTNGSGSRRPF